MGRLWLAILGAVLVGGIAGHNVIASESGDPNESGMPILHEFAASGHGWYQATMTSTGGAFYMELDASTVQFPIDFAFLIKDNNWGANPYAFGAAEVYPSGVYDLEEKTTVGPPVQLKMVQTSPGTWEALTTVNDANWAALGNPAATGRFDITLWVSGAITNWEAEVGAAPGTSILSNATGDHTWLMTEDNFTGSHLTATASELGARVGLKEQASLAANQGFTGYCAGGGDDLNLGGVVSVQGSGAFDDVNVGPYSVNTPSGTAGCPITIPGNAGAGTYTFSAPETIQAGVNPGFRISGADVAVPANP
ncbi:MAG: hypothetical protein ACYDDF_12085 [Thermoplasmatota archaeon]